MVVNVDTDTLQKFGISANDYLYLYLLYTESHSVIKQLSIDPDTKVLQTKGLVKLGEKLEDHTVRQEFLDLFQTSFDQMWAELLSHFPIKVNGTNGLRVLRTGAFDAKSNQKAKLKYKSLVGKDRALHDRVVKGLKNELDFRKKSDSLGFMRALPAWINSYTWENYEDSAALKPKSNGSVRITRKL
tara:strand:- start:4690 stop:5247 length:558 start_codon:yes stop_codon:yes gene_type:complete